MSEHPTCIVNNCSEPRKRNKPCCAYHWNLVPFDFQLKINHERTKNNGRLRIQTLAVINYCLTKQEFLRLNGKIYDTDGHELVVKEMKDVESNGDNASNSTGREEASSMALDNRPAED